MAFVPPSALVVDPAARRAVALRLVGPVRREVAICVRRHAAARGSDPREEERDLAQDVLVSLFDRDARELRRWDPSRGRSLESFVRLVARRRVARIMRRDRVRATDSVEHHGADARPAAEARALLHQLCSAFELHTRPRDRELFELVFVQELEPAEIATRVGMSRSAVNAWTYRKRQLARELANVG